MTRQPASDKSADKHFSKPAKTRHGGSPAKRRVVAGGLILCCVVAAGFLLLDRKTLPARVRNNAYVESLYREKDAALATGGAAVLEHGAAVLEHGATALEHHADALEHGASPTIVKDSAAVTPAAGGDTGLDAGPAPKKKQVGYPEADRAKLDQLIGGGAAP